MSSFLRGRSVLSSGLFCALLLLNRPAAAAVPETQGAYAGPWNPTHWYMPGQRVSYGDCIYVSVAMGNVRLNPTRSPQAWMPTGISSRPAETEEGGLASEGYQQASLDSRR